MGGLIPIAEGACIERQSDVFCLTWIETHFLEAFQFPLGARDFGGRIGNIELDPARRLVRKAGDRVHLTPKEFDLLHHLMAHAGLPMMHARLLQAVWGPEYGGELEYLRTFVRQLRKKIEDDPSDPTYLLTDSHLGYRFAEAKPVTVGENA